MSNDRRVLVLNKGESVINITDWQNAVNLIVKGNAIAPYGYDHHYKISISLTSAEKMQKEGTFAVEIVDDKGYFLLPTAIVIQEYAKIPYKSVAVNKRNVLKRDKNLCAYCGKHLSDTTGSVDHVVPRARWYDFKHRGLVKGQHPNNWRNVVASCKPCNCAKDNRTPEEAGMILNFQPFVPSRDFLFFRGINSQLFELWDRWINVSMETLSV